MRSRSLLTLTLALALTPVFAQSAAEKPAVEVLSPHWIALRFAPQYPHGRHTQNPLPGNSLMLPLPDSQMIKGQAGQNSDNKSDVGEFRIPVPDFAADAGVDKAVLIADSYNTAADITLDGVAVTGGFCDLDFCAALHLTDDQRKQLHADWADIAHPLNPAEFTISVKLGRIHVGAESTYQLFDATGPEQFGPTLVLHTRSAMTKPTGWHTTEQSGLTLPHIEPLFDQFLRDTSIVLAPDGNYYMTGTTGGPEMMVVTSDLSVWKSPDLIHWSPVRDLPRQSTVVWNIDRDGTWMKPITLRDGEPFRPLWAPEIHYINHTFWIPFSVPRHGVTLLKSTTGKAEGPYEIAIKPDQPISDRHRRLALSG